jgi:hypothetical protein
MLKEFEPLLGSVFVTVRRHSVNDIQIQPTKVCAGHFAVMYIDADVVVASSVSELPLARHKIKTFYPWIVGQDLSRKVRQADDINFRIGSASA